MWREAGSTRPKKQMLIACASLLSTFFLLGMITIPFPDKEYERYLRNCSISDETSITPQLMKEVMKLAYADFEHGFLSIDGISSIASRFLDLVMKCKAGKKEKELFDLLLSASEMSFYLQKSV
jgi:hypothetical protein